MKKLLSIIFVAAVAISACTTNQQILAKYQTEAVAAAEKQGEFMMKCDTVTGEVISAKIAEVPSVVWVRQMPIERQVYEVGVEGCGQRNAYKVLCNDNEGCSIFNDN